MDGFLSRFRSETAGIGQDVEKTHRVRQGLAQGGRIPLGQHEVAKDSLDAGGVIIQNHDADVFWQRVPPINRISRISLWSRWRRGWDIPGIKSSARLQREAQGHMP